MGIFEFPLAQEQEPPMPKAVRLSDPSGSAPPMNSNERPLRSHLPHFPLQTWWHAPTI